jgi:K+-sensing histidine kinase KdpD
MSQFSEYPYRLEDFKKGKIKNEYSIEEMTKNKNYEYTQIVKELGAFSFVYSFMKRSNRGEEAPYFYKQISSKRKDWLSQHSGIKIYRDSFFVRPYGDINSNGYDWIGLDARKGGNPVAVTHKSGNWHVNNYQGQGTVIISRIQNNVIVDKSNRDGIIENEHFFALKNILIESIAIIEKDRAYILRAMKLYLDEKNKKENVKSEANKIADDVLGGKQGYQNKEESNKSTKKLAQAVKYYEEERDELISEIKLLMGLATNGLITSSLVHDLKSINALLCARVDGIEWAIKNDKKEYINRNLIDLRTNDTFLKSWITVITEQLNKDRRRRKKRNLFEVISESIEMIRPILNRKEVIVTLNKYGDEAIKRIFISDFDSIIYNLIINSIESFEKSNCNSRNIDISLEGGDDFIIRYFDNGCGIDNIFNKNPYEIFNYGTTSKRDLDGNQYGTGLGMYIVASSINEYNGKYTITKSIGGFGLDIFIPLKKENM